jgi:hypothetical protein
MLPQFPSGGDPSIELFNLMTRNIEDLNLMNEEVEQRARLRAKATPKRAKRPIRKKTQ